ncbi:MAG: PEGA domain-containing protein [Polyangiaceae bacterium]|nr:PEGA domain-containing protein [Polyangiaceae bacterium]
MSVKRWIIGAAILGQFALATPLAAQTKSGGAAPKSSAGAPKSDPKADAKGAAKAEPTPLEKAKQFVKSGDKSAAAGEWEDAYADYSIAWTMYQGWETALGLGKSAAKTGHNAEAVARLTLYLKDAPAKEVSDKQRKELEAMIKESTAKTGLLTITAPPGGDVYIDRNAVGKTPLAEPVRLDPGKHEVEVRRGEAGESKSTEVKAGATSELKFEPPKTTTKVVVQEAQYPWRTPVLITGTTLTVGGLAVGGVFLGLSFDREAAKKEAQKNLYGRNDFISAANDEAFNRNVMLWGFIGAGVALAGTAAVFFLTRTSPKSETTTALVLNPGGLTIRGDF